jgi:hypothetical protein
MVSNFNNLSQEDKVVSGTKLMFSLLPCIALNAEKVRGEGAENLLRIAKEAEKSLAVPKPVIFSSVSKTLEARTMPTGISKSFTPQYGNLQPSNMPNWQQVARNAQELANGPFAPTSIGAAKVWTIKGRLKAAQLPIEGKIRFVPRTDYHATNPIIRGPNNGYIDRFGNEWVHGPSRTAGQAFEWDVQLSNKGNLKLGWASRDGKHINVSLDGKLTHR